LFFQVPSFGFQLVHFLFEFANPAFGLFEFCFYFLQLVIGINVSIAKIIIQRFQIGDSLADFGMYLFERVGHGCRLFLFLWLLDSEVHEAARVRGDRVIPLLSG
jgi:hypothetical protein